MKERPPAMERSCEYIEKTEEEKTAKGWPSSLGVGRGATTFYCKNKFVTKNEIQPRTFG
jgi:hypothetical protein